MKADQEATTNQEIQIIITRSEELSLIEPFDKTIECLLQRASDHELKVFV